MNEIHITQDFLIKFKIRDEFAVRRLIEQVIDRFRRVDRPDHIGHAAVEVGLSVRQVQLITDLLLSAGVIRKLNNAEINKWGIDQDNDPVAYVINA